MGDLSLRIKQKYPEYQDWDDDVLEKSVVSKYPEYKSWTTSPGTDWAAEGAKSLQENRDKNPSPAMPPPPTDGLDSPYIPGLAQLHKFAAPVMGTVGMPARGLGMMADAAIAAGKTPRDESVPAFGYGDESFVPQMETKVASDHNPVTGSGVETPGLGATSLKGLQDLSGQFDPSQTIGERQASNKAMFDANGGLGRVGKLSTAVAETGLGAATDPAMAVLGPLGQAAKTSATAAKVFTGLQRTMQAGIGIDSVAGIDKYIQVGNKYGFNSPQADDVGVGVAANLALVVGLEGAGIHEKQVARAKELAPYKKATWEGEEFSEPKVSIEEHFSEPSLEKQLEKKKADLNGEHGLTPPPSLSLEQQFGAVKERLKGKDHGLSPLEEDGLTPPPTLEPTTKVRSSREQGLVEKVSQQLETEGREGPDKLARAQELMQEELGRKGSRMERLAQAAASARERIAQRDALLQEHNAKNPDAGASVNLGADIHDYSIILSHKLAEGAVRFADWARELPEHLKAHAADIWDKAKAATSTSVTVYHGEEGTSGAGGGFWTRDPKRAASYGSSVKKVEIPWDVFADGQVEAKRQGQAGPMDTYLNPEHTRGATPHEVTADVVDATGDVDREGLLRELGITEERPAWQGQEGATTIFHDIARKVKDVGGSPLRAITHSLKTSEQLYQASLAGGIPTAARNMVAATAEGGLMAMMDGLHTARNLAIGRTEKAGEHFEKNKQRVKNLVTGQLVRSMLDNVTPSQPKNIVTRGLKRGLEAIPGQKGMIEKNATLEAMGKDLVPTELHERFRHLHGSDVLTQQGPRPLTPTEKAGKFLMVFNELQERAMRLSVMKVELAPTLKKHGVKTYKELWEKASLDPSARIDIGDAVAKAETAALQRTKGLGPSGQKYGEQIYKTSPGAKRGGTVQGEIARRATALFNSVPGIKLLTPFTNYTINNFAVNMMEANPITASLTERANKGIMRSYESDITSLKEKVGGIRGLERAKNLAVKEMEMAVKAAPRGEKAKTRALHETKVNNAKAAFFKAQAEISDLHGRTQKQQAGGVYSDSFRASLVAGGPALIALSIALRLRRGEDGLDWSQTPGEKDAKGNRRVRNISPIAGALSPYAAIGDFIARQFILKSNYYNKRVGKKLGESVTGGGQGRPGPLDVWNAYASSDESGAEKMRKFAADIGGGFGKMGWVGDVLDIYRESSKGKQKGKRPDLVEKPSQDTPVLSSLKRGVQSHLNPEAIQDSYDSSSGEKREKPTVLDTLLHLGASEQKLSPLSQFLQSHPGLDPRGVLLKQAGVPVWDETRYSVLRTRLEKEVLPVLSDSSMPDSVKEEFVRTRLASILKTADAEAKRRSPASQVPEGVVKKTEEKVQREKLKKENKKLFPSHIPASHPLKKGEERKFERSLTPPPTI